MPKLSCGASNTSAGVTYNYSTKITKPKNIDFLDYFTRKIDVFPFIYIMWYNFSGRGKKEKGDKLMPNMDDFYAFKSTSGENRGASGCLSPTVAAILLIIAVIYFIVKLFD